MSGLALISVVDDDEATCRALERLFRSAGFLSQSFGSAEQYLRSERHKDTKVLVLDVKLPGISGLDLQVMLKLRGDTTPIVFVSAGREPEVMAKALRDGAYAFLHKPFDADALLSTIQSAVLSGRDDEAPS